MNSNTQQISISFDEMKKVFQSVLLKYGFEKSKAEICADTFASNSLDGVLSHGVYRFNRFIDYIEEGIVKPAAVPTLINKFNGIEQWNGNLGPGILNAFFASDQSMKLANDNGIGCVALSNTNHWMRAGTYARKAALSGFVFIGWTNTTANMPAWGATNGKLGNNPLVIGIPYKDDAIVLDIAMSQFSFGKMEMMVLKNEKLSVVGGFDVNGKMSNDPGEIIKSRKPMPMGYWKGAGLSLLLDILATVLSGGLSTHEISKRELEFSISQVFVSIDISKLSHHSSIPGVIDNIITDYKQSIPNDSKTLISYPGERVLKIREENLRSGIPVLQKVWDEIVKLQA